MQRTDQHDHTQTNYEGVPVRIKDQKQASHDGAEKDANHLRPKRITGIIKSLARAENGANGRKHRQIGGMHLGKQDRKSNGDSCFYRAEPNTIFSILQNDSPSAVQTAAGIRQRIYLLKTICAVSSTDSRGKAANIVIPCNPSSLRAPPAIMILFAFRFRKNFLNSFLQFAFACILRKMPNRNGAYLNQVRNAIDTSGQNNHKQRLGQSFFFTAIEQDFLQKKYTQTTP